jgi:hypothetical protein
MSGTNAEVLAIDFIRDSLLPWIRAWESSFDVAFGLQEQGLKLHLNEAVLLRPNKKDEADYLSKMTGSGGHGAIMSIDEARAMVGLNPLGGVYSTPALSSNGNPHVNIT